MSGMSLGTVIDLMVAVLLVVTIAYCVMLDRRLKMFRGDENAMRETIRELLQASEIAERAIGGLKEAAGECDKTMTYKLRQADRYCRDIDSQIEAGQALVERLSQIGALSRELGLAGGEKHREHQAYNGRGAALEAMRGRAA